MSIVSLRTQDNEKDLSRNSCPLVEIIKDSRPRKKMGRREKVKSSRKINKKVSKPNDAKPRRKMTVGRFDKKTVEQACKRLREGLKPEEVGKELGVLPGTIARWRQLYFTAEERKMITEKLKKRRREAGSERMIEACNLFKQGLSTSTLAKRYGVNESTILTWRNKFAPETVMTGNNLRYSDDIILKACRALKKGSSPRSIASKMGIPQSTAISWQTKYIVGKFEETTPEGTWEYGGLTKFEACSRLKQGIPMDIVARGLKVHVSVLKKWNKEMTEPKNGQKFSKSLKLEACELLKQGETVNKVAKKLQVHHTNVCLWKKKFIKKEEKEFNSFKTIVKIVQSGAKYSRKTVLTGCKLLLQGDSTKTVARKLKLDNFKVVQKWRREYLMKGWTPKDGWKYNRKIKLQIFRQFKQGIPVDEISEEFGVSKGWLFSIRPRYFRELTAKSLERKLVKNSKIVKSFLKKEDNVGSRNDKKLKARPVVVLTRDLKIDQLCRLKHGYCGVGVELSKGRNSARPRAFVPLRKVYLPIRMKLKFVEMIDQGISIGKLSRELNVNELTVRSWMLNRELLIKSAKIGNH